MQIIPGILESSFDDIDERVSEVAQSVQKVHVDICDGLYVQSKTWPYSGIKTGRIEENFHITQLLTEEIGLPLWESVEYQFDLMIKDPWRNIGVWAQIGATSVVIHPTSIDSTERVLETIQLAQGLLMDVYVAYTYTEWKEQHATEEKKQDLTRVLTTPGVIGLQCMTIKQIGVQGQDFDTRWLEEIPGVRKDYPHLFVQCDGGVNEDVADDILDISPDSLVIGSGIFKDGNPTENVSYFTDLFA